MTSYVGALSLLVLAVGGGVATYAFNLAFSISREPLRAAPFSGGTLPGEHPLSRFHARFYTVALLFLAFDLEIRFMYPWTLAVAEFGRGAVIEMFGFLALLLVGIAYAWREGAFRWA